MTTFCPNVGSVQAPVPSGSYPESLVALPGTPAGKVCRIAIIPSGTKVIFGTSTVSSSGGTVIGMPLNAGVTEYYIVPAAATHAVFYGGGNGMGNIIITMGEML